PDFSPLSLHDALPILRRTAEEAVHDSDLLLFVVDAKEGLSPIDEELARVLRKSQKPVILVINKIDNEKHEPLAAEFDALGFASKDRKSTRLNSSHLGI